MVSGSKDGSLIALSAQGRLSPTWKELDGRKKKKKKEPRPTLTWHPPPPNKLKWNVEGSAKGKQGVAGIGGVLRNDQGNVITMFSAHIGIKDSNEANFMAFVFALELSTTGLDQEYEHHNRNIGL